MRAVNFQRSLHRTRISSSMIVSCMLSHRTCMLRRVHCAANAQQQQGVTAAELTQQQQAHLAALQQVFTPLEVDKLVSSKPSVLDLPTGDWLRFFEGYGLSKGSMWTTLRWVENNSICVLALLGGEGDQSNTVRQHKWWKFGGCMHLSGVSGRHVEWQ